VKTTPWLLAGALLLSLIACGEKPQTAGTRKSDARPSDGPASVYSVAGWKAGDNAAWESQMRARAQSQNEYVRTGAQ
jgi:hypothetical protein